MNSNESDAPQDRRSFLAPAPADSGGGMLQVAASRAAQETQGALVIAKKFPRDEIECISRVKTACQRKSLAELSMYSYPRGGQTVTGPSIRLAEVLARAWGNMEHGVVELEQREGESTMMAFAWDYETNTRATKVFTVAHVRATREGKKELTDPRDIYEMTANQGARRLRACILSVIPIDVQEAAIEECEKTLRNQNKEPLKDRITAMVLGFKDNFGVPQESIEKKLGHRVDAISEQELVNLRKIYVSLKDSMSKREDWFEMPTAVQGAKVKEPSRKEEAPAGPPPAPGTHDVLYDADKPLDSLASMMRRDSLTDAQVVTYAKSLNLAGKAVEKVSEIRTANLQKLCENWVTHLPEIQKIPAGE